MNVKPTRKVGAAGLGGAAAVIIVWVVGAFGVDVPAEVASAFSTVLGFAAGWLITE